MVGLWLSFNYLYGNIDTLSKIWERLPFLMGIDMSYNSLFGKLPDMDLPLLTFLDLYQNQITGTIPDFIGIPAIKHLEIDGNLLSGTIPDFHGMPLLTKMFIGSSNLLTGLQIFVQN